MPAAQVVPVAEGAVTGKPSCPPVRLRVLGNEGLAIVSFPENGKAGEALDWLATALPAARSKGGAAAGSIAALAVGAGVGAASVVVTESALRAVPPPKNATVETPWVALEVSLPIGSDNSGKVTTATVIAALGASLTAASIVWRTLPAAAASTILLVREEDLTAATVTLARGGHAVSPPSRVCLSPPEEDQAAPERNSQYVGVWSLLKREEPIGNTVEEHPSGEGPLRLQAPSGVFAEIRIPERTDDATKQESCAGIHAVMADSSGQRRLSVRHRLVDFRPPSGNVLCTQVKFDREVMGELSHPKGRCREEYIEAWTKIDSGPVVALELIGEVLPNGAADTLPPRTGFWLFCGNRFVRILGPRRDEGIVAGACCGSLRQLETLASSRMVRDELRQRYEACWGNIVSPGLLRIGREAWSQRGGEILFDAAKGIGGSITFAPGQMFHRLPNGAEQRWRIRDWGFDPLTPAPASAPASGVQPTAVRSASESSSRSSHSSASSSAAPAAPLPTPASLPVVTPAVPALSAYPWPASATLPAPNVASLPPVSGAAEVAKAVAAAASPSRSASGAPSAASKSRSGSASSAPSAQSAASNKANKRAPSKSKSRSRSKKRHRDRRRKHRGRRKDEKASGSRARSRRRRHKHRRRRRRESASASPGKAGATQGQATSAPAAAAAPVAYPFGPYPGQPGSGAPGMPPQSYPFGPGPVPDSSVPRRPGIPPSRHPESSPPSAYPGHGPHSMPPPGYPHVPPPGYPHGPPPGFPGPPGFPMSGPPPGFPALGHGPPPGWPGMPGPMGMGMPPGVVPGRPPNHLDPIAAFVQEHKIDGRAEETLRGLPTDVLQRVLAEGGVTGNNPSAVLMGRIRNIEDKIALDRKAASDRSDHRAAPRDSPQLALPAPEPRGPRVVLPPEGPERPAGPYGPQVVLPPSDAHKSSGPQVVLPPSDQGPKVILPPSETQAKGIAVGAKVLVRAPGPTTLAGPLPPSGPVVIPPREGMPAAGTIVPAGVAPVPVPPLAQHNGTLTLVEAGAPPAVAPPAEAPESTCSAKQPPVDCQVAGAPVANDTVALPILAGAPPAAPADSGIGASAAAPAAADEQHGGVPPIAIPPVMSPPPGAPPSGPPPSGLPPATPPTMSPPPGAPPPGPAPIAVPPAAGTAPDAGTLALAVPGTVPAGPAPAVAPAGSTQPSRTSGDTVGSGWGDPVPARMEGPWHMRPPHMWPPHPGFMPHGMPAMPPTHGYMPPFGHPSPFEERIVFFCRQYSIDASAERVLRQLHPQAQQRVLDEGPVGSANPSLELISRIHKIEAWEHGQHLQAFLSHCHGRIDPKTDENFRGLQMEAQRAVMSFGPLMSADPSGELMARVRDVMSRGIGSGGSGSGPAQSGSDDISVFASQNVIDASAEAALRGLPHDLQRKVIDEGPVRGTKNPSAVLMSRIRRVRTRSGSPSRSAHAAPGGPGRGHRSRSRRSRRRSRSRGRSRSRSKRRSRSRSRSRSRRSRRSRGRRSKSRSRSRSRSRKRSRSRSRSKSRDKPSAQQQSKSENTS